MELSNVDVKKYAHVNKRCKRIKGHKNSSEEAKEGQITFENQFPDGARIVKHTTRQHKHYFSQNELDQMVIDYTENKMSVYDLAEKFECNRKTIAKRLREKGVIVTHRALNSEQLAEAAELYTSGLSLKKVADYFGVDPQTVKNYLIASGVAIRSRHKS